MVQWVLLLIGLTLCALIGVITMAESSESDRAEEGPTLCDMFLDRFTGTLNHEKVDSFLDDQDHMLETLEVTNEKMSSLNDLSEKNFQKVVVDFRQNTRNLIAMKKELDSIFRRIRLLKMRLAAQYPEAYAEAEAQHKLDMEEEDVP